MYFKVFLNRFINFVKLIIVKTLLEPYEKDTLNIYNNSYAWVF